MRVAWLQLALLAAAVASATAVPSLGGAAPLYLVLAPMFVCIVFAWMLVFENDGMQRSRGWRQHLLYGFLLPRWSNWSKPVELSFNAWVVLISAAVMVGALLRIFWTINA